MSDSALPESLPDADIEAMKRLADGDDLALNGIMHRWKDKVAAFLYRMTGSAEAAADLAQETFVRLYQSRARYQHTAAFPTYLFPHRLQSRTQSCPLAHTASHGLRRRLHCSLSAIARA
jgi:hypothetical protein